MATQAPKKPAAAPEAEAAPVKKKGKGLLYAIIGAAVLLAAGGGGAAYVFMQPKPEADAKDGAKPAAKPEKPRSPPVYMAMETFTVNLQPENGEHLLQTTFSLKVTDSGVESAMKQKLPEVRSRLLLLLSSKKPSEILSTEGKQTLANEIAAAVNEVLSPGAKPPAGGAPAEPGPVQSVFFTNFIVQ